MIKLYIYKYTSLVPCNFLSFCVKIPIVRRPKKAKKMIARAITLYIFYELEHFMKISPHYRAYIHIYALYTGHIYIYMPCITGHIYVYTGHIYVYLPCAGGIYLYICLVDNA